MEVNGINYTIRAVKPVDLDQLFVMLVDLVKHEGTFDRFKMTRQRLETELFGEGADWHCLVAADSQEKLLGFCLYTFANINRAFNETPMIQVDDLYVSSSCRKAKIGQYLLYHLAKIAKNKNISRLNVWCVKDNIQGQNFYQKIGGDKVDIIDVYAIKVEQLLADLKS